METIKTYLDNMFARLPRTAQIIELKNNILTNMEEKYLELKTLGKSENEAIGIVISEFGNIDELVSELGLNNENNETSGRSISREEVNEYIALKKVTGIQIALGVFLCIMAPIVLILINALIDSEILIAPESSGIIALFIIITIAVAILIKSGMSLERYKYIEEGVLLPYDLEKELRQEFNKFMPTFNLCIVIGVSLILLSPISLFVTSQGESLTNTLGLIVMLIIVDIAVVLFVISGNQKECYDRLLKTGDYTPKKKMDNKVIGAVASIVWPLAALIFLTLGFVFHLWYICWIVFPITGILFGMFSAAYSIMTENSNNG